MSFSFTNRKKEIRHYNANLLPENRKSSPTASYFSQTIVNLFVNVVRKYNTGFKNYQYLSPLDFIITIIEPTLCDLDHSLIELCQFSAVPGHQSPFLANNWQLLSIIKGDHRTFTTQLFDLIRDTDLEPDLQCWPDQGYRPGARPTVFGLIRVTDLEPDPQTYVLDTGDKSVSNIVLRHLLLKITPVKVSPL